MHKKNSWFIYGMAHGMDIYILILITPLLPHALIAWYSYYCVKIWNLIYIDATCWIFHMNMNYHMNFWTNYMHQFNMSRWRYSLLPSSAPYTGCRKYVMIHWKTKGKKCIQKPFFSELLSNFLKEQVAVLMLVRTREHLLVRKIHSILIQAATTCEIFISLTAPVQESI